VGGDIEVRVYVYNRTDRPQAYKGDVSDEEGNLLLSGGWSISLEEVAEGKTVSSRDLRRATAPTAALHTLEPQGYREWKWKARVSELTDHPGSFRFRLTYGKLAATGQLFRIAKSMKTPDHIRVTYTRDKEAYFIGEPVTVTFRIENQGRDVFLFEKGGDYRGATRHLRFYFTGETKDGVRATDPKPNQMCMGGLGGVITLKPGETHEIELPLLAYLSFDVPGVYTVEGYQDLGFGEPAEDLPSQSAYGLGRGHAYGASFRIELSAPAKKEMTALIRSLLATSDKYERRRSLSLLHNPRYLEPMLEALARESDEARTEALLAGIGSILTPESTERLIELASGERTAVRAHALRQLSRRMPRKPKPGQAKSERTRPWNQHEIESAWDERFRPLLPTVLRKGLASDSAQELAVCADCAALLGDPELMPLLAEAADRIAPEIPIPTENVRAVRSLAGAAYALSEYGLEPVAAGNKSSPGRLAVWANSVLRRPECHTKQWEDLLLHMMKLDCPLVQHYAIRWLPKDFKRRAQVPWKALLSSEKHEVWWYAMHVARRVQPGGLTAIVSVVLEGTEDRGKRRELRELIKAIQGTEQKATSRQ